MKSRKKWLTEAASLCAEIRPEDGVDPKTLLHKSTRKKTHHKTHQVCKQAEKTLNLVLAESTESLLRELVVYAVVPNPDSAHLLVVIEAPFISLDENEVLEALQRAEGRLRTAIATVINRKRTPQISFRFIAS